MSFIEQLAYVMRDKMAFIEQLAYVMGDLMLPNLVIGLIFITGLLVKTMRGGKIVI
jgi:hypothetical protein